MSSDQLSREQAEALKAKADTIQRWSARLVARCNALGFRPDDPVLAAAVSLKNSALALSTASHYVSCRGGVARGMR